MKFTRIALSVAVCAPLLAASPAGAQEQGKQAPGKDEKKPSLTDAETQAMARLHHGNTMEVDMGKLGTERARSPEVKSFAARMVRDHKKADDKLMALARKHGLTLAAPAPRDDAEKRQMDEQSAAMNKLRQLEGEEFDREFMTAMVKDHERTLQLVSDSRAQAKDPALLALLKSVQPVIQKHLLMAQKLSGKQNNQPGKGG